MAKPEIQEGQIWQEWTRYDTYGDRLIRITELLPSNRVNIRLVDGPELQFKGWYSHEFLRQNWRLIEETPKDRPWREIRLVLAKDTTARECGSCRCAENSQCSAFGVPLSKLDDKWRRVSECVVAEAG